MQKFHNLSEDGKEDPKLEKLKTILIELTDHTYLKIYEIQELEIELKDLECENLNMKDILITVFSNLISNIIGKILVNSEPNVKLSVKYFKEVTEQIYLSSTKFFTYFVENNTINKKDMH